MPNKINFFQIFPAHGVFCDEDQIISISAPPAIDQESDIVIIPNLDGSYQLLSEDTVNAFPTVSYASETEIVFELYTRTSLNKPQLLEIDDVEILKKSSFNQKHPTIILAHGWRSKGEMREIFRNGKNYFRCMRVFSANERSLKISLIALFAEGSKDVNFIYINWESGSSTFNYISARRQVSLVSRINLK